MDTYRSPYILPSILHAYKTPFHVIHAHIITEPPPDFRAPSTSLLLSPSPAFFHAHCFPYDPNLLILVSSDQIFLFQSSTVQSLCANAQSNLSFLCLLVSNGLFFFTTVFIPVFFNCL